MMNVNSSIKPESMNFHVMKMNPMKNLGLLRLLLRLYVYCACVECFTFPYVLSILLLNKILKNVRCVNEVLVA